jgi:hypothetical protein
MFDTLKGGKGSARGTTRAFKVSLEMKWYDMIWYDYKLLFIKCYISLLLNILIIFLFEQIKVEQMTLVVWRIEKRSASQKIFEPSQCRSRKRRTLLPSCCSWRRRSRESFWSLTWCVRCSPGSYFPDLCIRRELAGPRFSVLAVLSLPDCRTCWLRSWIRRNVERGLSSFSARRWFVRSQASNENIGHLKSN